MCANTYILIRAAPLSSVIVDGPTDYGRIHYMTVLKMELWIPEIRSLRRIGAEYPLRFRGYHESQMS